MSKIAIVGMGRVGAAAAYSIGLNQIADQILAIDNNQQMAIAQTKDLQEAMIVSGSKTRVEVNSYTGLEDVDILIITAGAPVSNVVDRLDLFASSKRITESIVSSAIAGGFKGVYIVASNPVDVMTAVTAKHANISPSKVIGTGTIIDNSRLKYELANLLDIDPSTINSLSVGEHGNSIVPVYSQLTIDGQSLESYLDANNLELDYDKLTMSVTTSGPEIFNIKGATEFAIASSITEIVKAVLGDTNQQLLVTALTDVPTVGQVYIPVVATVGKSGYSNQMIPELNKQEMEAFIESAKILKQFSSQI